MNLITVCATYTGDVRTDSGVRTLRFEVPGTGSKPVIAPIFVVPSYAAGDTCAAGTFQEGSTILINGRLYPNADQKMYLVPTQHLQAVDSGIEINQVSLAGGVGFISPQRREDAFNFGLMCQAPKQKLLSHDWQDSLPFRIESWGDDAKRLKKFVFVGRQISLGGQLRFEMWTGKDGLTRTNYKIRVRSAQYSFFGKSKKDSTTEENQTTETSPKPEVFESPHQQAIAKATEKPSNDGIPF